MDNLRFLIFLISISIAITISTSCCSGNKNKKTRIENQTNTKKTPSKVNKSKGNKYNSKATSSLFRKKRSREQKQLATLYKGLKQADYMMDTKNYEGALRAVKRVQHRVKNNPYIEMQAWYLSVEIYGKMDKKSSSKRAMRKMIESLKNLQKHPDYQKSDKDGKKCKEVIDTAMEQGKGKYDFD